MNNRAMKDSGVEWMGEIPESWEVSRTKNHFSVVKRIVGEEVDSFERLALTMNGVVKRSKTDNSGLQPEKFENYQILKPNELVFKLIDLANVKTSRVGISDYKGLVSPAYIVLTNDIEDNRYSYYFFMNMYYQEIFNKMADDGVRSSLSRNDLLNFPFLLPPLHEQQVIATYLDEKVSNLDQLIRGQQRVIEEWKAYKQSLITETVTKGLNPEVELKDSGIEWIGEIPSHWEVNKISRVVSSIKSGGTPLATIDENYSEDGVLWVTIGDMSNEEFVVNTKKKLTQRGIKEKNLSIYPEGTILYSIYATLGKVSELRKEATINQAILAIQNNENIVNKQYLKRVLNSMEGYVLSQSTASTQFNLSAEKVKNFKIPFPPLHEQQQIANFLDEKCSKIDQLIEDKQRLIEDLKAYKQSLIYECVTGKKEIV